MTSRWQSRIARPLACVLLCSWAGGFAWGQDAEEVVPPVLPETRVEADLPEPEAFEGLDLPEVSSLLDGTDFSSPAVSGYLAPSSTTGTMLDVPDIDLPMIVDTVTQATIEDQQILNLTDALRNVPGAIAGGDRQFADRLFLRGLEVRPRDFRKNGFLDPTYTPRDFANIERVEILKGPASVLYGSAAPSGTVNFITKKPIDARFSRFEFQPGSFGQDRYTLDTNGYVTGGGNVLYRFNGSYENSDSFRDFGYTERHLLAPSLRWLISENTMLTWEGEYLENRRRGDLGIPAINGDALALPPNRYVGEPANDFIYTEDYRSSLVLEHRFADDWSLYAGLSTMFSEFPTSQTGAFFPTPGPTFFVRDREVLEDQEDCSSLIVNVAGDVCWAGFDHRLLVGTEQVYFQSESAFSQSLLGEMGFDAANPVYLDPATLPPLFEAQVPIFRQVRHGYYLQDLVELSPNWQVLAGARFDEIDFSSERIVAGFPFPQIDQRFERVSPRVGLVYQPLPEVLSLYANYSRSFNPPSGQGLLFASQPLEAELGESWEAGVKAQLLEQLVFHAAGFHVTRQNTPFLDTGTVPFPTFLQVGEERAQGVELELLGEVTQRLSLLANYAYTDTRLSDPNDPLIFGQRQRNVPLNQASFWSRYDVIQDCTQTLGAGLGLVYVGDRTANLEATVDLPSYSRWDAGLYYRRGRLDALVYFENLFDVHYAASSLNELRIFPGAPFNVRAQLGVTF